METVLNILFPFPLSLVVMYVQFMPVILRDALDIIFAGYLAG
jgi:hypothetical protein